MQSNIRKLCIINQESVRVFSIIQKYFSRRRKMTPKVRQIGKITDTYTSRMRRMFYFKLALINIICALCLLEAANALAIDQKQSGLNQVLVPSQAAAAATAAAAVDTASITASDEQALAKSSASSASAAASAPLNDKRRPIWALAHMVNSIKELDYRLARGSNAVEIDVTFGRDGDPLYTYHGPPCDCLRHCYQQEELADYLSYVREIAIDSPNGIGQNLSLLFMDLKLDSLDGRAKARAGGELAKLVVSRLFLDSQASQEAILENTTNYFGRSHANELELQQQQQQQQQQEANKLQQAKLAPLHLILSVNHVQDVDLVRNFIHYLEINNSSHLMQRIGFDVGMNDELGLIESMWRVFGKNLNLWQGDGFTNCLSPFYNLERLTRALGRRDQATGFPAKVYHWTIDLHDRIRESLRLGVDAIMTNHPERVLNVLQEPDMAHNYRLASRLDNPFKKLPRNSAGRSNGETARYQRSANLTSGGLLASLFDVLSSWVSYVREIPIFSLPTTLVGSSRWSTAATKQRSGQTKGANVSLVKLQNQSPEYGVYLDRADQIASKATAAPELGTASVQLEEPKYEGPKWYTTLASNMLVSMMKILLPSG